MVAPPARSRSSPMTAEVDALLRRALDRASVKDAVSEVASATGRPRREIYQRALALDRRSRRWRGALAASSSRAPRPERVAAFRAGLSAESRAAAFLIAKGYRILARRFRTPVGEIDIVARPPQHAGVRRGQGAQHARRRGGGRHRPRQAAHRGGRRSSGCRSIPDDVTQRDAVRRRAGRARQDAASHSGGVRGDS